MGAGWIAQGADTPAPASGAGAEPWSATGPDTPSVPALTRPHQDPTAHPVDNTRGLLTRGRDLLFGHEPESPQDTDQAHVASPWAALGASVGNSVDTAHDFITQRLMSTAGPDTATLAKAYPHLVGAQFGKLKAGVQESYGAAQVQNAERQLAALNVLPQVAARYVDKSGIPNYEAMAADPLVKQQAIQLGLDPREFAGDWAQYQGQSPEQQADTAARAKDTLERGRATEAAGGRTRAQAWVDERVWRPTDPKNGPLDPWSLKSMGFEGALAIPAMAAVAATTVGAGVVGGPAAGVAAGAATAAAIFGPQAYADTKDKVQDQATHLFEKADDLDANAAVGSKRGLNPITQQIRQQAADLLANADKIARTAGFLNAVGAAAGNAPVASVLARSPVGKAVLDRIVGAAASQTVGGRIAGSMVANGVGTVLQTAIQQAVDSGIVHEQNTLQDALAAMGHAGIVGMLTALPVVGLHEATGAPSREAAATAKVKRDLDSDELRERVKTAADAMGARQHYAEGEDYPGYRWNDATRRYEPTETNVAGSATRPRIAATEGQSGETNAPPGETPAPGAPGARAAYQAKTQVLNEAAAAAEKRSDVTLEPEEEGWSVHVKGQPVATFDTVEAARAAMAQARKLVGTKPAASSAPAAEATTEEVAPSRIPETALERTQPVQAERRSHPELRQRVSEMTAEQAKAALLTHELTGMPNRRAYQEAPKKAVQVSADSDGLKAINDVGGHAAGDQALKAVAAAMQAEDPHNTFHVSGDEFTAQADTEDGAHDLMARVNKRLEDAVVEVTLPDGQVFHLKGLGVSYGVGKDFPEADGNLQGSKTQREAQGLRAPRGSLPPGATVRPGPERRQGDGGQVAGEAGRPQDLGGGGAGGVAKVLGQKVETPAVPTPAQAKAGNYFKPAAEWHGLPIKVENTKGQVRKGIGANGKPFSRTMKADYGYFAGTKGADEDGVDVMMGPHHDSDKAFVIDQLDHTGKSFDEHKIQIGVRNEAEARAQYLSHYPKGWKGLGGITELTPPQLKRWLKKGDLTQPIDRESVPQPKVQRGAGPDARHDSILEYLARHPRGLDRAEAQSQGIDPADMRLTTAHVGIKRAFRAGGLSFDHAAESLAQDGYPVTDAQGHYSPNVLLDRISDELAGRKHFSTRNESALTAEAPDWRKPLSDGELAKLTVEQAQARLAQLQEEQERLEREIERAGLSEEASEHETEEELDRIPFQRKEGAGQQDLFGDKVHVQNEIKRLEAALDKKRNSGQESVETGKADDLFSSSRQQMDLPKIGEETTRYALREPPLSAQPAKNLRSAAAVPQLDLFANADLPAPAVQAARLAQSVKLAHIGEFRSGISQVKTWEDAAHILAPLRKYPQENMTALVLDQAGKPLAVIRHSIGQADAASVEPWSLAGSVAQVPGAAQVFFAHNHPSGYINQSTADEFVTLRLHNLLEGSGIRPRGMIVVGPNRRSATYHLPERGEQEAPITAARRQGAVSVQERRFARLNRPIGPLTGREFKGPEQAKVAIIASGERSGVVLANNRHQVMGIVPMTPDEMLKLRTGDPRHGAARLLRAMAEGNANAIVAFGPLQAARNVVIFGNASGAKALDYMTWNDDGTLRGANEHQGMPGSDAFLQRQFKPPEGWPRSKSSMSHAEIRQAVDQVLNGFSVKPEVVIAKNLAELKQDPDVGPSIAHTQDGEVVGFLHPQTMKVYLVADQFHTRADVAATLAHEVITHFGLRAAFGDANEARYQAILDGVRKAIPADFRARGEAEFPGRFNPLNAHMRNRAAEETLAYFGQRYAADQSIPARIKRWLDKLHALIRDWLRKFVGAPKKFDELFIKRTLADLESFLRRGKQARARPSTETEPAFAGPQDTFFSGLARAVDAAKRDKGTGAEWEATLRNLPGVKQEEMQWVGLKDWLAGRGRVSKAEVADYVHAHRVQVGEKLHGMGSADEEHINEVQRWFRTHGEDMTDNDIAEMRDTLVKASHGNAEAIGHLEAQGVPEHLMAPFYATKAGGEVVGAPRYGQWASPGGHNYRELLLTLQPSPETARVLAVRKQVFEQWAPKIAEIDKQIDDRLYGRGPSGGPDLAVLQSKRDQYTDMRDEAAAARAREIRQGELYNSPHWQEQNVLSHIRFDDRTGPNGERILHLHEVQSDWHQKGRKFGYAGQVQNRSELDELHDRWVTTRQLARVIMERNDNLGFDSSAEALRAVGSHDDWEDRWPDLNEADKAVVREYATARRVYDRARTAEGQDHGYRQSTTVPDAPFKTTWPELAMKRMLRYAAEQSYDGLSWDTGETNAERYNLSKHIDAVEATKHVDANGFRSYQIKVIGKNRQVFHNGSFEEARLADFVGKELAEKIINQPPGKPSVKYEGLDLKVGGEGMKKFYDQMLPAMVGKLVKKWGGHVERSQIDTTSGLGKTIYSGPELSQLDVLASLRVETPLAVREQLRDVAGLIGQGMDTKEAMERAASPAAAEHVGGKMTLMPTAADTHLVRITPQMRDSVMQGQPLFLKRRKGSTGEAPPAPKRGAYDLARRAVAAIPNNELTMSLRRIVDPAGVSPSAKATALVTREALGELAQASEEALRNLEQYAKAFDVLSTPDRYAFIDAMEAGKPQPHPEHQPAADAIRQLLDDWRERIRGLGTGALDNFIENYFPHIWQRDDQAKKVFGQIFGRRPLKGPASFLKERTIPTTKEGLEAGLQPISTNPLILAFAKLREMQRFYTGVKLMQRFKDEGLAKFKPLTRRMPEGWTEINDAVGRVMQWSEDEGGFILRGHYIMPTDAARVINNHLSASALRNFLPAQVFRVASNAVNALQLGFSAFHLGFTTLDAIISKNALAIERLLHGEPLRAAAALLEGVLGGPLWNIRRGRQLLKAYTNIAGASPELRRIVEGLIASGGRVKMDNYFQAAQGLSPFKGVGVATLASDIKAALTKPRGEVESLTKVLMSFPQQYATRLWRDLQEIWRNEPFKLVPVMSAMEIAGRMTRASTSVIMEHIVPWQKLGVFADLAADHIRRNPLEDPVAFAGAMQQIWNSVDNRLGEMVYDALFWNRTFKDVNHMMVRAVGWNLGTIRELGGAPVDVIKALDYMARGAPPELLEAPGGIGPPPLGKTSQARLDYEAQKSKLQRIAEKIGHKLPYALALVGTTMVLGAILQYLFTGEKPKELKDYFFPRTGRLTKYGTPERISLPSYMKDIYEYSTQPATTVINKANPIFGIMHAIYANEDFFGNAIRSPDKGFWYQALEGAQYAAHEVLPFSVQGTKQFVGAGAMDAKGKVLSAMPYFGLTPAPARVTSPEQMERYQLRETEKKYIRGLQYRLKQAMERNDTPEVNRLRDEIRESKMKERGTEHEIREDKEKAREAAEKISSIVGGQRREDAAQALEGAGLPAFAALWRSLPETPRPRVAASLGQFA